MAKPSPPLPPDVIAALERGQLVEALKRLIGAQVKARGQAGPGATASAARSPAPPGARKARAVRPVPAALDETPSFDGRLSPGEVPRARSALLGWVVFALVVYLIYRAAG